MATSVTEGLEAGGGLHDEDEATVKRLIAQYKEGDRESFTEIVRRYKNQVESLAFKMVNNRDEAADIAQTVFVKMAANIGSYDERRRFYTWLYRVTANASIDHLRKRRRHNHEPLENYRNNLESSEASPERSYHSQQLRNHIEEAAGTLNDRQRNVFMLRDIEGCKVDDVANMMDMPAATVRWYVHRARAKIRRELMRRCPQLLVLMGIR